jgi:acyl-CoA reductase-like NAD-dependent aldehyde dehydrogenase
MAATTHNKTQRTPGELDADDRKKIDSDNFAFPKQRKEPLNDADHVRNAIARFDQVKDVTDDERAEAFKRIEKAAKEHGVEMKETSWHQLGKNPHTENKTQ